MKNSFNLQDIFLSKVKKDKITITIFLMSGYQLRGVVNGFDNYTIVLNSEGTQQMIYKHAISTMIPSKKVSFNVEE